MSTTIHRSSKAERSHPHPIFFRDLASPISAPRSSAASAAAASRFATPGQAAAVSALRRESSAAAAAAATPPPPPVLSLDDRPDFSPEPLPLPPAAAADADLSPSPRPHPPLPARSYLFSSPSPLRTRPDEAAAPSPRSASWWSPARSGGGGSSGGGGGSEREEKGKGGSPVEGVVQPGVLITLPPPREVARPEIQRNALPVGEFDEEEWVTVYGFSPADTNLVLREFEKCGVILRHIPGPRNANWMHILYQSRYDAQKAIAKHAQRLNSVLIIGVKPIDSWQRQYLNESLDSNYNAGFMAPLPSPPISSVTRHTPGLSSQPYQLQNGVAAPNDSARSSSGAIASPTKSVLSKVMDLMFGI